MRFRTIRREGFTLVEILVTLMVVITLAALLLPGMQMAMEKGRAIKCVSNLHQIGSAYMAYIADNSGNPPEPIDYYKSSLESRTAWEGGTIKAVGLGKLQYSGMLVDGSGVAVKGNARSKVFHCPKRTTYNGWAYSNDNWIDYCYLLTGRYQRDVFSKPSTAIATDVQGGVGMAYGIAYHYNNANVLYADGSIGQVSYAIYSTKARGADMFDRDYVPSN
jgi:prepilin-type processing-associated H-X9-DG protein